MQAPFVLQHSVLSLRQSLGSEMGQAREGYKTIKGLVLTEPHRESRQEAVTEQPGPMNKQSWKQRA